MYCVLCMVCVNKNIRNWSTFKKYFYEILFYGGVNSMKNEQVRLKWHSSIDKQVVD